MLPEAVCGFQEEWAGFAGADGDEVQSVQSEEALGLVLRTKCCLECSGETVPFNTESVL